MYSRLPWSRCICCWGSVVLPRQVGIKHRNSRSVHWTHRLCSLVGISRFVNAMNKEYYLIVEVTGGQKILLSKGKSLYGELTQVRAWKHLFEGKYYACHKEESGYVCDKSAWAPSREGKIEWLCHEGEVIVHAEDEEEREVLIPIEDSYLTSAYILGVINEHVANAAESWERIYKVFGKEADAYPSAKNAYNAVGYTDNMERTLRVLPVLLGAYYRVRAAEEVRQEFQRRAEARKLET